MRHSGLFSDYLALVERLRGGASLQIDHDLCSCDIEHALRFAKAEEKAGIRATYLPLHTEPYWNHPRFDHAMEHLRSMGHRIGVHHDAIGVWTRTCVPPHATLKSVVARLRKTGPVTRAAAHGCPASYKPDGSIRFINYEAWEEFDPAKNVGAETRLPFGPSSLATLGLTERYFDPTTTLYVSDSHGSYRHWRGDPRPRPYERVGGAMVEGLPEKVEPTDHVVLLAHPVYARLP